MGERSQRMVPMATGRSPDMDPFMLMRETSKLYKKCQQTHTLESLNLARQRRDIDNEERWVRERFRVESRGVQANLARLRQAKITAGLARNTRTGGCGKRGLGLKMILSGHFIVGIFRLLTIPLLNSTTQENAVF